jgi:hypothetical protein
MKKNFYRLLALTSVISLSAPAMVAFADGKDFKWLVNNIFIGNFLQPIVPLFVSLAVVIFIYGVITTMLSDGEKREDGKKFMFWGIIGLFVMVSVWGLVAILQKTFGLETNTTPTIRIERVPNIHLQ